MPDAGHVVSTLVMPLSATFSQWISTAGLWKILRPRDGCTQLNTPWITKSVLPTAHSRVHNRINTVDGQARHDAVHSFLVPRMNSIATGSPRLLLLRRTRQATMLCHTSCILDK